MVLSSVMAGQLISAINAAAAQQKTNSKTAGTQQQQQLISGTAATTASSKRSANEIFFSYRLLGWESRESRKGLEGEEKLIWIGITSLTFRRGCFERIKGKEHKGKEKLVRIG
uniref:(northern house mosquito) hypothetical protein n=1 Tax=Culex pipiens TaxID=7175 RepID=A0A8D8IHC1_CULPI